MESAFGDAGSAKLDRISYLRGVTEYTRDHTEESLRPECFLNHERSHFRMGSSHKRKTPMEKRTRTTGLRKVSIPPFAVLSSVEPVMAKCTNERTGSCRR